MNNFAQHKDKESRYKILVVDDTRPNVEVITDYLEKDYEIIPAYSGKEALLKIKSDKPDIVLLDIIMPEISGYEVCEKIKQADTTRFTPVVMVTSLSELEDKVKAIEAGADDFLTKPVNSLELVTRIKSLLRAKYFHDQLIKSKEKIEVQNEMLHKACDELETRVRERTVELTKTNEILQAEITERKKAEHQLRQSLKEKEVLLREIHHRVKNNMQIISSLLRLQSGCINEEKHLEIFKECQNRIISMSLVHEKLYNSKDFTRIDFKDYITDMVSVLFESYSVHTDNVKLNINVENIFLPIDSAIPCGLIINELVTNSLKYAFPDGRKGEIKIELHKTEGNYLEILVSDNGIGMPDEFDFEKTDSLGLQLVSILGKNQLDGRIDLDLSKGTEFQIRFKGEKQ
ncbi:MAG TPA: histidine kinase dimerization/phosphoacceptor domain -containing protein [Candidatus Methanoperedens sp.]